MITQLNPPIPMWCDKGNGYAIAVIDYSQEHHLIWVIAIDETGEIWAVPNPGVRLQKNFTMSRLFKNNCVVEKPGISRVS